MRAVFGRRQAALALSLTLAACGESQAPQSSPTPSPVEQIAAIREAARITGVAQGDVLRAARPGLLERDVKGVIDAAFAREGAIEVAFSHIVASGPNAIELHYAGDTRELEDGDLLLVDIGAKYQGYAGDLSRTYPVNGRFTPRQREIYDLVLAVAREVADGAQPGRDSLVVLQSRAVARFQASPLRARDTDGVERTMDHFYVHSVSHYLGRQVHGEDTGWSGRQPLEVGQTLTIEPGLYIASEGIGIRIEDDYVVTHTGLESLSAGVARDADEIERLMAEAAAAPRLALPPWDMVPLPIDPLSAARPHMAFDRND